MVTRQLIALIIAATATLGQYPSYSSAAPASSGGSSSSMVTYSATGLTVTAGTRFAPFGGGATLSTTESDVQNGIPVNATVVNLFVQQSVAIGSGNTAVYTLRKNGSDQALTCTIAGVSATSCSDTADSFNVAQVDLLSISVVTTGTVIVTPNININVGLTSIVTPPFHSPITLLTHTGASNASSGAAYTSSGINTTGAKYLAVCVTSGNGTFGTVTDSKSNIWTPLTSQFALFTGGQLFYSLNPTVGTGHTFSVGTGGTFSTMEVASFSGGLQSFDVENGAAAGMTGSSAQGGTVTPSAASSLVLSCVSAQRGQAQVSSVNSGFTITDNVGEGAAGSGSALAYIIQTAITPENPTWTLDTGNGFWTVENAVFQ